MNERTKKDKISGYMPVITIFALVGVWYIIAAVIGKSVILPMPHEVFKAIGELLFSGDFYLALLSTLLKIFLSFLTALIFGVVFAVLSANSKIVEKLFYPIIAMSRAMPTMSIIFLCLLWFGAKISPVIVSLTVIFPVLYTSCLNAVRSCDKRLVEMSVLYNVERKTMIRKLYLPHVADIVYTESVSVLSLSVKLVIAAEALSMSGLTLGRIMQISNDNLETATLFAVTVIAVVLGILLEFLLGSVRRIYRRRVYGKIDKNQ